MARFNGKLVRWCPDCKDWFEVRSDHLEPCSRCLKYPKVSRCNRCGHEWQIYMGRYPGCCPGCKNPYYNRIRIQDRKPKEE